MILHFCCRDWKVGSGVNSVDAFCLGSVIRADSGVMESLRLLQLSITTTRLSVVSHHAPPCMTTVMAASCRITRCVADHLKWNTEMSSLHSGVLHAHRSQSSSNAAASDGPDANHSMTPPAGQMKLVGCVVNLLTKPTLTACA